MSFLWGRGSKPAPPPASEAKEVAPPSRGDVPGRSLELIRYDASSGKFAVGEEALRTLRATHGPVGVVSICGRARQGKSYILNQITGQSGGFTVGPTHRPCTKGLWVWSAPVKRTAPDGSTYSLVLLDTEGIDAYDQTGQYSTQIFSLAVLLSSLFVFNQMGGIDEAALDRLSLVTEMTKHIRVRAGGGDDGDELAAFTPSFLWLLRDFYLQLQEDGRVVTPREYLETALAPVPGSSAAAAAKNGIRASIKALFPDRDCFALVRPVTDERELARLDELPAGALRPEFREGMRALTALILGRARPKRLDDTQITGPMLAGLVQAYVEAINAGAVPTIATAWQGVAEAESRAAADAAGQTYDAAFSAAAPPPEEAALDAAHAAALAAAAGAFAERALGPESIRSGNDRRWREAVDARFQKTRAEALASAALAVEGVLREGAAAVAAASAGDAPDPSSLAMAIAEAERRVKAAPGGAVKWQRWAEWRRDVAAPAEARVAMARQQAAQAAADRATAEAAGARERGAAVARELADVRRALASAEEATVMERGETAAAQQAAAVAQQALVGARQEVAALQAQVKELQAEVKELQAGAAAATPALAAARQQATAAVARGAELERHLAAARQQVDVAAAAQAAAVQDAAAQVAAAQQAHQAALQGLEAARQQCVALETRAMAAEARVASAEAEAAAARAEAAQAAALAAATKAVAPPPSYDTDHYDSPAPMQVSTSLTGGLPPGSAHLTPGDVRKMTIAALKQWLTDAGQEGRVWELAQARAKKAQYEAAVLDILGLA